MSSFFGLVEQYREPPLVGSSQPTRIELPEAVAVAERAEDRLDHALPHPPQILLPRRGWRCSAHWQAQPTRS